MTWDLSKLYAGGFQDPAFLKDLDMILPRYAELLERACALKDASGLAALIGDANELYDTHSRVMLLVELTQAANVTDPDANRLSEKMMAFGIAAEKLSSQLSRFLKDRDLKELTDAEPALREYEWFLTCLKEDAKHVIAPELEDIILRMQMTGGSAFEQLRDKLDASLMIDLDGKKLPLSAVRGLAYSPDAETRRKAYEAELAAYPRIEEPMAACLNSIKGEALTLLPLRHYDTVLDTALDAARMDRETLDAMLGAMKEYLPDFRRFLRAKAKLLGYEGGLKFYDLFAPVGSSTREYTLDEARALIREIFTDFSPEVAAFLDHAFEDRWIDALPREGKVGGAFCAGSHPTGTSFVLANFDGSLGSVSTLAHELGHAFHHDCITDRKALQCDYPMPLAETASIFNETLLVNKLLERSDAETRVTLLDQQLTDAAQVIVDILSRFLFESAVVEQRKERTLTPGELNGIMLRAQRDTYGDGLDENCMHPYMWACKSHYYSTGLHFYNFPYAFGLLFGMGVYAMYPKMGDAFLPMYKKLLRTTCTGNVRTVAASVGIDVAGADFWRGSLNVIRERINEFCRIAGA